MCDYSFAPKLNNYVLFFERDNDIYMPILLHGYIHIPCNTINCLADACADTGMCATFRTIIEVHFSVWFKIHNWSFPELFRSFPRAGLHVVTCARSEKNVPPAIDNSMNEIYSLGFLKTRSVQ